MSSVASSVKIAATSGSKSTDSSGASRLRAAVAAAGGALAAFAAAAAAAMRCSRLAVALLDALEQLPVVDEVAGRLIEVASRPTPSPTCSRPSSARSSLRQPESAAEGAAQPVIERLGEADAVARLRHLRAARERVAGAVDLLGSACGSGSFASRAR